MLKKQEKALNRVITNFQKDDPMRSLLGNLYCTEKYVYATDKFQCYRLPNDTGMVTYTAGKSMYPTGSIDKFVNIYDDFHHDFVLAEDFNTIPAFTDGEEKYAKVGNHFYNVKYLKNAIEILGKKLSAYTDPSSKSKPMYLVSDKGEAAICAVHPYYLEEI